MTLTQAGRFVIDLADPRLPAGFGPEDIAAPLSRVARFCGQSRSATAVSVAEHSCRMADAAIIEQRDGTLALHCLLHDAHEAIMGDIPSPTARHLDAVVPGAAEALDRLRERLDAAIYAALRQPRPSPAARLEVAALDGRALETERARHLPPIALADAARAWGPVLRATPLPQRGFCEPWPPAVAKREWLERYARYAAPILGTVNARDRGAGGLTTDQVRGREREIRDEIKGRAR